MKIPRWLPGALIGGYFVALAVLVTYPLITHLATRMIGQVGDNIYFVWLIGWFQKAIFVLHVNPFDIWFLNYPAGWSLAYTEISAVQILLAMPFALLVNTVFGYNISMLLTFVLSGVFMYLWMKALTNSTSIGLIIGTAYAMLPYHQAHFLIGHLNISGIQWFPLYFWGLFELLKSEPNHSKKKFGIMAGISLGLIGLTSMYYLYMTILVTGVLVLFNMYLVKREITQKNYWIPFLWLGVSSLPLVLLSIWPYAALNAQGGLPDRSLDVIRVLAASASPLDYILPSTDHFLVGKWINQIFNRQLWVETTLYIGLINLFFAGIGIWTAKKQNQKPLVIILLIGIAFAWLLSLGTDLFWNGERVLVQIPPYITNLVNRSEMHIPMPGLLLFKYLPFFSKLRVFARFGIFVLLFIFTLSALGLKFVLDHIRKQQAVVVFSMTVLLFVWLDFYPGPYQTTFDIKNRPVDVWLASQPGDGAVIQFPFSQSEDQVQVYATLAHGKPFVGGFFNAFPPQQYLTIKPVMENFPDKDSVVLLDELGVKYVLADVNSYKQGQEFIRACESLGLKYVDTIGDEIVFINGE